VRACWQAIEVVEPPRGLFAMVEALEATTLSDSIDNREPEEASNGLDRLRRLVFLGRSGSSQGDVAEDPGDPPVAPPPVDEGRESAADASAARFMAPPPPPGGQLHDAQPVTPALRLTYRGDARMLKEAAVEAVNQRPPRVAR
jgi:hypothetical protein